MLHRTLLYLTAAEHTATVCTKQRFVQRAKPLYARKTEIQADFIVLAGYSSLAIHTKLQLGRDSEI